MKYLVLVVVFVVLGWFGFTRYLAAPKLPAELNVAAAVSPPVKSISRPAAPPLTSEAAPPKPLVLVPAATPSTPLAPVRDPNARIKIDIAQALRQGNHYHDDAVGLSVTFPEGWVVDNAIRWGEGHTQNTVFLQPDVASSASPSMFYKPYTAEEAATIASTGAQALLREQAQKKEASRVAGMPDYRNVPDSFLFYDVNGSPAMSYFATFTRDDQVMTEHFIRVLSPKGYVMFFTTGKFEDVKAIMPQLKQASVSVKGP